MEELTDRELEVFRLIGQGHGTRQIAEELHLSVKTVESYHAHIKDKLSLKNARELVQHAVQWVTSHGVEVVPHDAAFIGESPIPFIVVTTKINTGCDGLRRRTAFPTMPVRVW